MKTDAGDYLTHCIGPGPPRSIGNDVTPNYSQMQNPRPQHACTCIMRNDERDIGLIVHGDDSVTVGDHQDLIWFKGILEYTFEISTAILGHEEGDQREVKVPNGVIIAVERGFMYEADGRHTEVTIRKLGRQDAKPVTMPGSDAIYAGDEPLDNERYRTYISICARANLLSVERGDLLVSEKGCCREISKPTTNDYMNFKRLGRRLVGKPRLVHNYPFQEYAHWVITLADASWASMCGIWSRAGAGRSIS